MGGDWIWGGWERWEEVGRLGGFGRAQKEWSEDWRECEGEGAIMETSGTDGEGCGSGVACFCAWKSRCSVFSRPLLAYARATSKGDWTAYDEWLLRQADYLVRAFVCDLIDVEG